MSRKFFCLNQYQGAVCIKLAGHRGEHFGISSGNDGLQLWPQESQAAGTPTEQQPADWKAL